MRFKGQKLLKWQLCKRLHHFNYCVITARHQVVQKFRKLIAHRLPHMWHLPMDGSNSFTNHLCPSLALLHFFQDYDYPQYTIESRARCSA